MTFTLLPTNNTKTAPNIVIPWKDEPWMVGNTARMACYRLCATVSPSSPNHLSLAKVTTTYICVNRMADGWTYTKGNTLQGEGTRGGAEFWRLFLWCQTVKISAQYTANVITAKAMVNSLCAPWRYVEMEIRLHSFLTSALNKGKFSFSHRGRLTSGEKDPSSH